MMSLTSDKLMIVREVLIDYKVRVFNLNKFSLLKFYKELANAQTIKKEITENGKMAPLIPSLTTIFNRKIHKQLRIITKIISSYISRNASSRIYLEMIR